MSFTLYLSEFLLENEGICAEAVYYFRGRQRIGEGARRLTLLE
jgi:hypothetical protein